jgi:hypothetical protein
MAHESLQDGTRQTRLNESEEHLAKREELRLAEIESMKLGIRDRNHRLGIGVTRD